MIWCSIDVGIKNCSVCVFSSTSQTDFSILYWENIDLTNSVVRKCQGVQKKGIPCKNNASFVLNDKCYCKLHLKQLQLKSITKEFKTAALNKKTISEIKEISEKMELNSSVNKKQQIVNILSYTNDQYYKPISSPKLNSFSLVDLGKTIVEKFDALNNLLIDPIEMVIIENQIGPLAIKMKTLQGMITQYFIMRNSLIKVEWISSHNKLKEFSDQASKSSYKDRKKLSIEVCSEILKKNHQIWKERFLVHKKKDDLADSFLQGIWYLRNKLYLSS